MNFNRNHNPTRESFQRTFQQLQSLWRDWLGQLTFILLVLYALYRWRQWAAIFIAILFIGMFHQRILSILTEFFACINDFFLGTPVDGDVNAREGGLIQGIGNVAGLLWGWVLKPFQPREPKEIPPVEGDSRKAAFFRRLADSIDSRKAESLRRRADLVAERYSRKQEKRRQKAMEDSSKSLLTWTHLIGAAILTILLVVFIAGELVITLQTLLGMMDVPLPEVLDASPLFKSFEMMTAAVLVCAGILFGIYILDLLGFLPLIPLHLLSINVQRIMLGFVICCCVGTFVVVGSLAAYRCVSLQDGMDTDVMGEPMTGDVTDLLGAVPTGMESASSETLTATEMEAKLITISLVGISLLGAIGTILAFNGTVVLLVFLTLGVVALISGGMAAFGLLTRLLYRLTMIGYSILHMIVNALLGMMVLVARPFGQIFALHRTDLTNDEGDNVEPPAGRRDELPPRESPRTVAPTVQNDQQSEANQSTFDSSDAEWNPLA